MERIESRAADEEHELDEMLEYFRDDVRAKFKEVKRLGILKGDERLADVIRAVIRVTAQNLPTSSEAHELQSRMKYST